MKLNNTILLFRTSNILRNWVIQSFQNLKKNLEFQVLQTGREKKMKFWYSLGTFCSYKMILIKEEG